MISQTVEYALRAVVTIAQHDGIPCTSRKIADITQVPFAYLSKLMQGLVRGGIVSSRRGKHGGFVLTKDVDQLTVLEIVESVDPIPRIRQCPLKKQSHTSSLCPLHMMLDTALEQTEKKFRQTVVADLLSQPGSDTPLCEENELVSLGVGTRFGK
ncbi:MAG: Rrf2 family transcriptional regulator [Fuerstiella sp.]|nr:Rrf2 family transcriptional regulator [Fuerstiella sp.]